MVVVRLVVLPPPLSVGKAPSSGSRGVGSGEGKCRLVRSGREPPVLRAEGMRGTLAGWSGDGKMLRGGEGTAEDQGGRQHCPQHHDTPLTPTP